MVVNLDAALVRSLKSSGMAATLAYVGVQARPMVNSPRALQDGCMN
jgi:hypothetical protein